MTEHEPTQGFWLEPADPAVDALVNGTIVYLTTPLSAADPYDEDRTIQLPLGQKCVVAANRRGVDGRGLATREIEFSPLGVETMPVVLDSFCLGRHGFPFSLTPVMHRIATAAPEPAMEPAETDAPGM